MKRALVLAYGLACFVALPAVAAEVTVSTGAEFQAALTTAASNGEPDTINMNAGTYVGVGNFFYGAASTENQPLTIHGAGAGSTIISVAGSPPIELLTFTLTGLSQDDNVSITVDGVGFQNGGFGLAFNSFRSDLTVQNCDFSGNSATALNAVVGLGGALNLVNNTFSTNGQALTLISNVGPINLEGNLFENHNTSGTVQISGGTMELTVVRNIFRDNFRTISGGGLEVSWDGTTTLTGNLFLNNGTSGNGGAIRAAAGSLVAADNIFLGNYTMLAGQGGALFLNNYDSAVFTNNTFAENRSQGGGGALTLSPVDDAATTGIYNNIFFANGVAGFPSTADDVLLEDDFSDVGSPSVLSHNIVFDFLSLCQEENAGGGACVPDVTATSNNAVDPLFVNLAADDVNLSAGSPAIGAGDGAAPSKPVVDFNGNPLNSPPDLGALAAINGILVNPLSMNFGNTPVGTTDSQPFTVTNNGAVDLHVGGLTLSDTTNYSLDFSECGDSFTLAPAGSCQFIVNFTPSSENVFNATLTIDSYDIHNPSLIVTLTGVGISRGGGDGGGCALGDGMPSGSEVLWGALLFVFLFGAHRLRRRASGS